jgi:actin-related protein
MIVESIGRADIDIRRDLFQNVVLSGGNTLFKGFLERLQRQIPDISP